MFIHGSLTGGGGTQYVSDHTRAVAAAAAAAEAGSSHSSGEVVRVMTSSEKAAGGGSPVAECRAECGSPVAIAATGEGGGLVGGAGNDDNGKNGLYTVCDHTCASILRGGWQIGGQSCGAGDEERYGSHCRLCYKDAGEALRADRLLESRARQAGHEGGQHVIMCDTMRPPESTNCSPKCATKLDTVSGSIKSGLNYYDRCISCVTWYNMESVCIAPSVCLIMWIYIVVIVLRITQQAVGSKVCTPFDLRSTATAPVRI